MKIEILEITAPELLAMLATQNPVDICKLLISTLALQLEQIEMPELKKEVGNELADVAPELILNNFLYAESLKEAVYEARYYSESEITCSEIAEIVADSQIKQLKGE